MELLQHYFREKMQSHCWLLGQIQVILRQIETRATEIVSTEHRKLSQQIHGAKPQIIQSVVAQLKKDQNLYLVEIVQQIIGSMRHLAQSLIQKLTFSQSSINHPHRPHKNILYSSSIPPTQPPTISTSNESPKIQIKIPQRPLNISSNLNIKQNIDKNPKTSPQTSSNISSNKFESVPSLPIQEIAEFEIQKEPIGENHNILQTFYKQQFENSQVCVESCLQLDNKIYSQASNYLNQVKSKMKVGQHSRSTFTQSPIIDFRPSSNSP